MKYIKKFSEVSLNDIALVGGKNASLGLMIQELSNKGIQVPQGFAITADAYWHYLNHNNLEPLIQKQMERITSTFTLDILQEVGATIRSALATAQMPPDLEIEIQDAYKELSRVYHQEAADVAVRSSATAEDLPGASFAGQQETFLNVQGVTELLESCKKCFASLFTDRAIVYRKEKGFDRIKIALSIGVQKMVRSDLACAGVAFSLDTETGCKDVIMINSSWGLGELVVQGSVTPDEYVVHKPTARAGFRSIIKKQVGSKEQMLVYTSGKQSETHRIDVPLAQQHQRTLADDEVLSLAKMVQTIEDHYSARAGTWTPMDVEWAKDGLDGRIYIVQARPETVHALESKDIVLELYQLNPEDQKKADASIIAQGQSVGQKIVAGKACIIQDARDITHFKEGDILVTRMTDPDWVPLMKKAGGIITQEGGRTCHAAIVSRELGIPALIGVADAMEKIKPAEPITLDCSQGGVGYIYRGTFGFTKKEVCFDSLAQVGVDVMVNLADPERAFSVARLPVDGVGLARIEFIITNVIKAHPLALLHPEKVDEATRAQIKALIGNYSSGAEFFIETLASGIAYIAAAFYPRPVIVRLSDFKTNEYRNLIGGSFFEKEEENPMIGFRGASRYYDESYKAAFALECTALKKVREEFGLENVKVMVPFVRTVPEGKKVVAAMAECGLVQGRKNLSIIMMCEIPANVILIEDFLAVFDGISIGSNDLTQLTLGVDRDSHQLADIFDERDPAVKKMIAIAIAGAKKSRKYSGICGQAPSDYPEVADFVIEQGIDSISLNPDSVIPFLMRYKK